MSWQASLSQNQLELAIQFAQILSMENLNEVVSILSSYDWNINKALGSIDFSQIGKQDKGRGQISDSQLKPQAKQKKENVRLIRKAQAAKQERKRQAVEEVPRKQKHQKIVRKKSENEESENFKIKNSSQIMDSYEKPAFDNPLKKLSNHTEIQANKFFLSHISNKYRPALSFAFFNFAQNLKQSFNKKKYLLVYVHILDAQVEQQYDDFIRKILKNQQVASFANKNCIAFGILQGSEDYKKIVEYLPKGKILPVFALFRYNHIKGKEEFLSYYNPQTRGFNFLEWISITTDIPLTAKVLEKAVEKLSKYNPKSSIKKQVKKWLLFEDSQFEDKLYQYKQDDIIPDQQLNESELIEQNEVEEQSFQFKVREKEMNNEQQKKARENRQKGINLMQEQDKAYKKLQKSFLRNEQVVKLKHQQINAKEKQLEKKKKEAEGLFSIIKDERYIDVKLRLPSGANIVHKFRPLDKVEKLFIYVDLFCRDHFQQKFNDFDLTLNYSDLVLKDEKSETIEKTFDNEKRITIFIKQI